MKTNIAFFVAGLVIATTSFALAAPQGSRDAASRKITLRHGDIVLMPELRWECLYLVRGVSAFTDAPPGPTVHCGRLGAWIGGVRTHVDLYYVVVRRGTNAQPRILLRERRP